MHRAATVVSFIFRRGSSSSGVTYGSTLHRAASLHRMRGGVWTWGVCGSAAWRQRPSVRLYPDPQVSLASDFMWNWKAREATASFGYDYMLRQCRLRGRIDSEGKVRHQGRPSRRPSCPAPASAPSSRCVPPVAHELACRDISCSYSVDTAPSYLALVAAHDRTEPVRRRPAAATWPVSQASGDRSGQFKSKTPYNRINDAVAQVGALLEERLNQGVNFLLSGEIDHWKKVCACLLMSVVGFTSAVILATHRFCLPHQLRLTTLSCVLQDYKFGFGLTVGE